MPSRLLSQSLEATISRASWASAWEPREERATARGTTASTFAPRTRDRCTGGERDRDRGRGGILNEKNQRNFKK
jgi:hypothetical protein